MKRSREAAFPDFPPLTRDSLRRGTCSCSVLSAAFSDSESDDAVGAAYDAPAPAERTESDCARCGDGAADTPEGGAPAGTAEEARRREVARRMEVLVLHLLHHICRGGQSGVPHPPPSAQGPPADRPARLLPSLRSRPQLRRLRNELLVFARLYQNVAASPGAAAAAAAAAAARVTQRDLYYHLCRAVPSQEVVNRCVARIAAEWLCVPREALGVTAASRGAVAGTIRWQGSLGREAGGGSAAFGGPYAIPTRAAELSVAALGGQAGESDARSSAAFTILPETRCILVIEKHAVFFQLQQEQQCHDEEEGDDTPPSLRRQHPQGQSEPFVPPSRRRRRRRVSHAFLRQYPCVLLTACGYPNRAAQQLLHNMHRAAPHLPIYGLVDYNSDGIAILAQYRLPAAGADGIGSARRGPHPRPPARFALSSLSGGAAPAASALTPQHSQHSLQQRQQRLSPPLPIRWLGLRSCHLPLAGAGGCWCKPFTSRDHAVLEGLLRRAGDGGEALPASWAEEARRMQAHAAKYEIECLYDRQLWGGAAGRGEGDVSSWVLQRLLRHDYID